MFWTDSVKDRIEVASLDGSQRRVIIDSDLVNPRAIITDPPNGCVKFLHLHNLFLQHTKNELFFTFICTVIDNFEM